MNVAIFPELPLANLIQTRKISSEYWVGEPDHRNMQPTDMQNEIVM